MSFCSDAVVFVDINRRSPLERGKAPRPRPHSRACLESRQKFTRHPGTVEGSGTHDCEAGILSGEGTKESSPADKGAGMFHPEGAASIQAALEDPSVTSAPVNKG